MKNEKTKKVTKKQLDNLNKVRIMADKIIEKYAKTFSKLSNE